MSDIYERAERANAALDASKLDITQEQCDAADDLLREAYRTTPTSVGKMAELAELALQREGDIDPWMVDVLTSMREAALKLAN